MEDQVDIIITQMRDNVENKVRNTKHGCPLGPLLDFYQNL